MGAVISSESHKHRQLQHRIRVNRALMEEHALRAMLADRRREQWDKKIDGHTAATVTPADGHPPQAAQYIVMLAALMGVFIIDVLLFGPVAEYFAARNFGESLTLDVVARLALPLAIILLDLCLSVQTQIAQDSAGDGLSSWTRYKFWAVVSFLFAVVLPAGVTALFLVSTPDFAPSVSAALLIMLGALALVGHLTILFGRRPLIEALGYLSNMLKHLSRGFYIRRLEARRNDCELSGYRHRRMVAEYFREYWGDTRNHFRSFPEHPLEIEPFDKVTLKILREIFGEEVVAQQDADRERLRRVI